MKERKKNTHKTFNSILNKNIKIIKVIKKITMKN